MAPVPAFFPFDMKPGRPFYDTVWPADVFGAIRQQILDRARGARSPLRPDRPAPVHLAQGLHPTRLVNEAEIAERLRPLASR